MKLRLKFVRLDRQEAFLVALSRWRRWSIATFCAFHLAAISWWLVPTKDYGNDARIAPAMNWLARAEDRVINWKRDVVAKRSWWIQPLESYCFLTSTYQSWRMFAPNPINAQSWMAVYPIVGWKELLSPEVLPPDTPWKERRLPVYANEPVFKTYENPTLEARLQGSPFFYGFGFKIAESVFARQGTDVMRAITDFANQEYRAKTGKIPLGFHVLRLTAPISVDLTEPKSERFKMRSTVAFFHHY